MIFWEAASLNDRAQIFAFLYQFNPVVAEKTDELLESTVEHLLVHPFLGVQRDAIRGRLLIIAQVSIIVSYWVDGANIRVMRVLHQKQQFPAG